MIELKGIPVSPGISIRRAFLLDAQEERITQRFIKPNEVEAELGRFAKALAHAKQELETEQERTRITLGADIAQIFKFHQLMLEDRSLLDEMRNRIVQSKFTPEYAVSRAFLGKIKMLRSVKSDYIRDRDKDIED